MTELKDVCINPAGLGALGLTSLDANGEDDSETALGTHDFMPLAELIRRQVGDRAVDAVYIVDSLTSSEELAIDRGHLGSYRAGQNGAGEIYLYADLIVKASGHLGCSAREMRKLVLRHELGHHVAPATAQEMADYDSDSYPATPSTCRVETAAQLFAWLTSEAAGRDLMTLRALRRVELNTQLAYVAYVHFIKFATNRPAGGIRAGWLMAWQLSQEFDYARLTLPKRYENRFYFLREQIKLLRENIGPGSTWPVVSAMQCEFESMIDSSHVSIAALGPQVGNAIAVILDAGHGPLRPKPPISVPIPTRVFPSMSLVALLFISRRLADKPEFEMEFIVYL
jgi:hypothetical protein